MDNLAVSLCIISGFVAVIALISLCIAMMLWLIGLFGVGFEAVCRSFVVMTISIGVFAASEMMIGGDV